MFNNYSSSMYIFVDWASPSPKATNSQFSIWRTLIFFIRNRQHTVRAQTTTISANAAENYVTLNWLQTILQIFIVFLFFIAGVNQYEEPWIEPEIHSKRRVQKLFAAVKRGTKPRSDAWDLCGQNLALEWTTGGRRAWLGQWTAGTRGPPWPGSTGTWPSPTRATAVGRGHGRRRRPPGGIPGK
jgi:hypothetical protein